MMPTIHIPSKRDRGKHSPSTPPPHLPTPVSEGLRSASSSAAAASAQSASACSSTADPYSEASSPLTAAPPSPVTIALGPNGTQWYRESKASDPVFATEETQMKFERHIAPIQDYTHAPDELFPQAAAKFGLEQVDPGTYDPETLRHVASRLKSSAKLKCAKSMPCAVCLKAGRLPTFLYIQRRDDSPIHECSRAAAAGFPTLLFRWKPDQGTCLSCLYCTSRTKGGCPLFGVSMRVTSLSDSPPTSEDCSGRATSSPAKRRREAIAVDVATTHESNKESRRSPRRHRTTDDGDDKGGHTKTASSPDHDASMFNPDGRHEPHDDRKLVLLPDTTAVAHATATELVDLKLALARAQAKIEELQSQVDDGDSDYAAVHQERDDANAQCARAEADGRQHLARVAELEAQLAAAKADKATVERERVDAGKEDIVAQVAELKSKLSAVESDNTALRRERDDAVAERAHVEAKVGRLVLAQASQGQAEASSKLRGELDLERARVAERDSQLKTERARVMELDAGRASLDEEVEAERARAAERDNELASCNAMIEGQAGKIRRLEAEYADLEEDLRKAMTVKPMLDAWLSACVAALEEKEAEAVKGGGNGSVGRDIQMGEEEWLEGPAGEDGYGRPYKEGGVQ